MPLPERAVKKGSVFLFFNTNGPTGPGGRPVRPGDDLSDSCKLYVGNLSLPCGLSHPLLIPAGPGGRPTRPGDELPDSCKLYVGNLSSAVDDALLKQMFEPFGNVLHTAVIMDIASGESRGYVMGPVFEEQGYQSRAAHGGDP